MTAPGRDQAVAMLVSGGVEHAGGIGRWAGYLQAAWQRQGLAPALELVDTRGHGHAGRAAIAFASALLRLLTLRAQGRLGAIHANLSARGSTARKLIVAALARLLGVKLVLHLHGSGYHEFYQALPRPLQAAVRWMFAGAAQVLVLGEFWAGWVTATLGVERSRVEILYNGVPAPEPAPVRRAGPCHIVLLGRIGPRKGVPELIEALAGDALRGRAWRATLAGDGEVERFRRVVAERGLSARVALPGWLDGQASAALLASADILVLPSHAENLPMSVIEALAHGVAVVTTPVGATPELLRDGEQALFVPVGDAAALEAALTRLLDRPELRARIGAAGRAVFGSRLEIDALARRLAGLHAGLLADAAPQPHALAASTAG